MSYICVGRTLSPVGHAVDSSVRSRARHLLHRCRDILFPLWSPLKLSRRPNAAAATLLLPIPAAAATEMPINRISSCHASFSSRVDLRVSEANAEQSVCSDITKTIFYNTKTKSRAQQHCVTSLNSRPNTYRRQCSCTGNATS